MVLLKRDYLGNPLSRPTSSAMLQTRLMLCKTGVCAISPSDMAAILDNPREADTTLIIDCRSFMVYNKGHISKSQNIHCPPIVKRRSGGSVSLTFVITSEKTRTDFMAGKFRRVVVYDDFTNDVTEMTKDSTLLLVIKSLYEDSKMTTISYLRGGYRLFSSENPRWCTSDESLDEADDTHLADKSSSKPQNRPVELLPHLYLGDAVQATQLHELTALGITAVVNVSRNCNYSTIRDTFQYKMIPVDDTSSADIGLWFEDATAFIDKIKQNGGKTFVHCHAGISRSATICIAYIMQHKHYSLEQAYAYVKSRRKAIGPNLNFMRQLQEFESTLAKKKNPGLSLASLPLCLPQSISASLPCSPGGHSPMGRCSPMFQTGNVFDFSTPPASPLASSCTFFSSPLVSPS